LRGLHVLYRLLSACVILAACCGPRASAQVRANDPQAESVRQAAAAYLKALEDGNRDALLAAWTPDGTYVDAAGRSYQARPLIESEFAAGLARPRRIGSITDESVRLVTRTWRFWTDDAARGRPGRADAQEPVYDRLGETRRALAAGQCARVRRALPPRNSRLAELRWLQGVFAGVTDDGSHVVVTAVLSNDGNYLLREFAIKNPDETLHSVSQRIGWDALADGFRSWTFDSDGGYTEGTWKRQADSWIVHNSGVTAEGRRSSAMGLYTSINEQGFLQEIVGAMLDNQPQPDVKVKMVRQTEQD